MKHHTLGHVEVCASAHPRRAARPRRRRPAPSGKRAGARNSLATRHMLEKRAAACGISIPDNIPDGGAELQQPQQQIAERPEPSSGPKGSRRETSAHIVPMHAHCNRLTEADGDAIGDNHTSFSRRRAEAARARLLATLPPAARARLRGCGGAGAGAWLSAAPSSTATRFT